MLLNLRGHDLLLQARKQRFALCYSQSHASRRDFLPPLDHPHLVFDGAAWDRLKYQLDCPFHPQRLTQPTTLHTLAAGLRFTMPTLEPICANGSGTVMELMRSLTSE
jgi:hypothetical protein